MDDHDTLMLSRLKDPWKFLMLDMDIAVLAAMVGLGALTMGAPQWVLLAAPAAVAYGMHKFREGRPKGWASHWRYWHFPRLPGLRRTPGSHCYRTLG